MRGCNSLADDQHRPSESEATISGSVTEGRWRIEDHIVIALAQHFDERLHLVGSEQVGRQRGQMPEAITSRLLSVLCVWMTASNGSRP